MSAYNIIPESTFSPNDEQAELIVEYVKRYGPLTGTLPDGVESTDPEYKELFAHMKKAGFGPSSRGWIANEDAWW